MKDGCTVVYDGRVESSDDEYIAVLVDKDGGISTYANADALTLGLALNMIGQLYLNSLDACSIKDRKEIMEILENEGVRSEPRGTLQ